MIPQLVVALYLSVSITSGCKNSVPVIDDARNNAPISDEALSISNAQYLAELENYKHQVNNMMLENDSTRTDFKLRLKEESKESNPYYNRQIKDLEQESRNMLEELENFIPTGKEHWEDFEDQHHRRMHELRTKHENLSVKRKTLINTVK